MEDRRNVGESSCNSGDGTDQRVQSLMFMMMIKKSCIIIIVICFCVSVDSEFDLENKGYFLTGFPVPKEKIRLQSKCTFLFPEKWTVTGLYLFLTRERHRSLPHSNSLKVKLKCCCISLILTI
jgi:hypothetical protein